MNKNIKYLIEELLNFDPSEYLENDDTIINQEGIEDVLETPVPENIYELKEIVAKRLKNNPQKPYLIDIDTSKITSMAGLFSNIKKVTVKYNGNNSYKIINHESILDYKPKFQNFEKYIELTYGNEFFEEYNIKSEDIKELDLTGWNTSNVTDMNCMFSGCRFMEKLNISSFNTENVISMDEMFFNCNALEQLDLSHFKVDNIETLMNMFWYCRSLETLNISTWNLSNVKNMIGMFYSCISLANIDFSNFLFNPIAETKDMFYRVPETVVEQFNLRQQTIKNKYGIINKIKNIWKK